jgi:hypothetical protein
MSNRERQAKEEEGSDDFPWKRNDLGLTDEEKAALVAFMEILSDGWVPRGKK